MSEDDGDVWSVREPRERAGAGGAGSRYPVAPGTPWERGDAAWVTAGALFLSAAAAQAIVLLGQTREPALVQPLYDEVTFDIEVGIRVAFLLGCGALLLLRRARESTGGLAAGFGLSFITGQFYLLRPSTLRADYAGFASWLTVFVFALVAAGTVSVLVALLRRRERVRQRLSRAERRVDRIVALVLGIAGGVVLFVADLMAWIRIELRPIQQTSECCSWPQDNGWKQGAALLGGATVIVLALFAATLRSKVRAAALLEGVVVAALPAVVTNMALYVAPMPMIYGLRYRQYLPAEISADVTLEAGFWVGLVGLLLLSAAAVSRLALAPRKPAYPQNELERIAS